MVVKSFMLLAPGGKCLIALTPREHEMFVSLHVVLVHIVEVILACGNVMKYFGGVIHVKYLAG
jgi:hypothetical protein